MSEPRPCIQCDGGLTCWQCGKNLASEAEVEELQDRIDVLEAMVKAEYPADLSIEEIIATWGPR